MNNFQATLAQTRTSLTISVRLGGIEMNTGVQIARPLLNKAGEVMDSVLKSEIAASWRRCIDQGLDPLTSSKDTILSYEEYFERRQRKDRHLAIARPEMELLYNQIAGHNYLVAFGDADGVVLDVFTDVEAEQSAMAKSIVGGSVWDEDLRGTNALGLAAKQGKKCIVSGPEHFFESNRAISCVAAPIFRSNGGLAGILNVTSPILKRETHTASLVGLAAHNISNRLFVEDHRHELIVFCHPREEYLATQSAGLLAFNLEGKLTGATAVARDVLPAIADLNSPFFSDLFQDGYESTFDAIKSGQTAILKDRYGVGIFVRVRPTRRRNERGSTNNLLTVGLPALSRRSKTANEACSMVFKDDFLNKQIEIAAETAAARLPIYIHGKSGIGLSETARAVHAKIPEQDHCIEVDCSIALNSPFEFALRGKLVGVEGCTFDADSGPLLSTPGNVTLILDGIETLEDRGQLIAKRLAAQLDRMSREQPDRGRWVLIVTERSAKKKQRKPCDASTGIEDFWGYSIRMPSICNRMDFKEIATVMLNEFAPQALLADDAIQLMQRLGEHLTFYSMRRILFQLSRRDRTGLITAEQVQSLLPQLAGAFDVCPACQGHATRAANCLRIRQTVRECDGNISLAARRLGKSRNTVYKHAGQSQ